MNGTGKPTDRAGHTLRQRNDGRARTLRAIAGVGGALAGAALVAGSAPAPAAASAPETTQGIVHAVGGLTKHSVPSTHADSRGVAANNSRVTIGCQERATKVQGDNRWYKLVSKDGKTKVGWVSAKYVQTIKGEVPFSCQIDGIPIGLKKSTHGYAGPSRQDNQSESIKKNDKNIDLEQQCVVSTHVPGGTDRYWVLTMDHEWVPGDAIEDDLEADCN